MKYGSGTFVDGTFWWTIWVEYVVKTCGWNMFAEEVSGRFIDRECGKRYYVYKIG